MSNASSVPARAGEMLEHGIAVWIGATLVCVAFGIAWVFAEEFGGRLTPNQRFVIVAMVLVAGLVLMAHPWSAE